MTKIYLASDHAGFPLKEKIKQHLQRLGHECMDKGTFSDEKANYAEYGALAAAAVSADPENSRAILVCGAGIGMSIVANKFKRVRAALCHDEFTAEVSRSHNNANALTLGARVLDEALALKIVDIWMRTPFSGGRHGERVGYIGSRIEDANFK